MVQVGLVCVALCSNRETIVVADGRRPGRVWFGTDT